MPGHEPYRGRLAIPFITRAGIVSMRFRCIAGHDCKHLDCPKYLGVKDAGTKLYNVEAFFSALPFIAITEGEIDAIAATMAGIPAVGCPGAKSWKPHYRRPFVGYQDVFVFADGDEAGGEWASAVEDQLDNATVVHLPRGLDVNDIFRTEGPEGLRQRAGLA